MAGVSRLRVGIDVPWVTSWSQEPMAGARPCASVGGRLAVHQHDAPGVGRPLYAMNHCRRQRLSVARMLCPMCGAPTSAGDRWMLTARRIAAGVLRQRGLSALLPAAISDEEEVLDAGSIAPMHRVCAIEARLRCPHLAVAGLELIAFPPTWVVRPLIIAGEPVVVGPAARLARPVPLIAFLQLYGLGQPASST